MVKYFKNQEYNQIADRVLLLIAIILLNRITNWFTLALSLYGLSAALSKKAGRALVVFMVLSLLPMINPIIMPRYGQFAVIARITSILMSIALIGCGSVRNGSHQIPMLTLFGYLFISTVSSAFGYFPLISYLKLINFAFFILAIYFGTRNIHLHPEDVSEIRYSVLAIVILLVYGSLMMLPFPTIAYFTSLQGALRYGGFAHANAVHAAGGKSLFSGITVHSQFLGPMVGCCFGWVLCDMWIVERKLSKLHLALLAPIPIIAFMTRSRLALVVLAVAVLGNAFYCLPKIKVVPKLKRAFSSMMLAGLIMMLVGGGVAEIRSSAVSRWLRKTDDLSEDTRSLGDAVTGSRQGLIEDSINDFRKNIFFGKGFQVTEEMEADYKNGTGRVSIFSASIEKGVLPTMILGEAGILGAAAFVIFLATFYTVCAKKKYIATSVLFTVYLSTNIAEATFFSPSGSGGVQWIFMMVGGFAIDMGALTRDKIASVYRAASGNSAAIAGKPLGQKVAGDGRDKIEKRGFAQ